VAWTSYGPASLNTEDVTLAQLKLVNFGTPGFLEVEKEATTTVTPLITSTETSGPFDAMMVRQNPQPAAILKAFKPQNKKYILAARVSGNAKSAFPNGPPKGDPKKKTAPKPQPHLKESVKPLNLIVVADTDFIADLFWLRTQDLFGQQVIVPNANNGDFVVNAADNLAGSSSLISLRSRGLSARPFELVQKLQDEAENRYRTKERGLVKELEDVQKKMNKLQNRERAKGAAVLSPEQQKAIVKFRKRVLEIRRELRKVQLDLRRDIDDLDSRLKIINIAAMPAAVAVFAIIVALFRRNRKRARTAE